MSDIDDVLDQFLCEGASGDWFARCESARLELAALREEVGRLRYALEIIATMNSAGLMRVVARDAIGAKEEA